MKKFAIVCGSCCVLLSLYLLFGAGISAAIDPKVKTAINKIAEALEKGDNATATKEAATLAKNTEELNDVMHAFKPRTTKKKGGVTGLGVGPKAGVVTPDGIELKINAMARDGITSGSLKKEGSALIIAAWQTAAIAEVAIAKAPMKDIGKKKRADWMKWSEEMKVGSKELAAAVKSGSIADVKTAATKINSSCNSCHSVFRAGG